MAGAVELRVVDNGSGLRDDAEPAGGLLQLDQPAGAFGGSLRVGPAPDNETGGTVLTLTMPYRAPAIR